ncbi:MAG TPA: peptide-methionine (S)-S-oxide reductase MsrA [Candidatus Saccharimonadales bacterium]|nr:peptide-methionine (S)-S-oxide reductase MsrA [Candidatus Saccharimonadales bacterium]
MVSKIVLGGGCFWCLEAAYQMVRGVSRITSGYAGGQTADPDYYQVLTGRTGHAEVVKLEFDAKVISLQQILDVFWTIHDPTSKNAQGADVGPQYRSIILYGDAEQRPIIDRSLESAQELFDKPIVTEVQSADKFYPAEAEHQDYFNNHPEAAYCQVVINPKLARLRAGLQDLLK